MNRVDAIGTRAIFYTIFFLAISVAGAGELRLPDLMQALAQTKTSHATFVEKKYIGIIDLPVESSGELSFTAPGKLIKRTLKPKPESLMLEGDNLTLEQPGKPPLKISLQERPEVSAFIESIRGTLAGDRSALEKFYKLELSGSDEKWMLVLVPRKARLATIISRIEIGGAHADIKTIGFDLGDGDHSEMTITKAAAE